MHDIITIQNLDFPHSQWLVFHDTHELVNLTGPSVTKLFWSCDSSLGLEIILKRADLENHLTETLEKQQTADLWLSTLIYHEQSSARNIIYIGREIFVTVIGKLTKSWATLDVAMACKTEYPLESLFRYWTWWKQHYAEEHPACSTHGSQPDIG